MRRREDIEKDIERLKAQGHGKESEQLQALFREMLETFKDHFIKVTKEAHRLAAPGYARMLRDLDD